MKLEGTFMIRAPKDRVWDLFMDPEKLAACLPGCEEIRLIDPTKYEAVMTVKIQFMTIRFQATGELKETVDGRRLVVEMTGQPFALAGMFRNKMTVDLEPVEGNSTRLAYLMDLQLTGRLASLGEILMRSTVQKSAREFADNVNALFS